jgi:transcriptional regulator with XRE-family HTH domain
MTFTGPTTTEEWESTLGEQFRAVRIAAGLDQSQLAARAGVALGSIKNLEQGRGSTLKTVIRVSRALGREDWLGAMSPRITVSPIDVLRSSRREPRRRVYRARGEQ